MIAVTELLYKLDMRLNKLSSNDFQSIPLENKVLALNEGQIKLVKKKLDPNNTLGIGLDGFKKRYEDVQNLAVPFEKMGVQKTDETHTSYQADINTLKYEYFIPLEMYAECSRGNCTNRTIYIERVIRHGDLFTMMANNHFVPSFLYQETMAIISSNNIIVYSNDPAGDFVVDNIYLNYLRYPQKIDFEGYIHFDGTPSSTQDCELVEYLADELLDLTVLELAMDTGNIPVVQYDQIRNKNNE